MSPWDNNLLRPNRPTYFIVILLSSDSDSSPSSYSAPEPDHHQPYQQILIESTDFSVLVSFNLPKSMNRGPDSVAMTDRDRGKKNDPFLVQYQSSELKIASEFLTTWLPFLSRGLCRRCKDRISSRIHSLDPELDSDFRKLKLKADVTPPGTSSVETENVVESCDNNCHSDGADVHSIGSWKDGVEELYDSVQEASSSGLANGSTSAETSSTRMSWADMAQEDEFEEDDEQEHESNKVTDMGPRESVPAEKPKLSRDHREYIRFMNVKRKKDFMCFERIKGKLVNIAEGLELHKGVFSAAEQKRIVDSVYELQEKGAKGELKERTFSAPLKWMRGKGRVTIQFGCCYNYAVDKNGNPPGILHAEVVDPLPHLFKVIIRRLVRWHVLPPTCVPDSCIVNIYDEGDCIPPHIDNHDFVRPFCTVSFLSECNIIFGSNLKIVGPGEFDGPLAIPLPVGSVLVLNGNGADVAKHCVPAVPAKRISITFRRMDESERPIGYAPEPDLLGIKPLRYGERITEQLSPERDHHARKQPYGREDKMESRRSSEDGEQSQPNYSHQMRRGRDYRPRFRVNLDR